jgi:tRNA threonylcarbamoyladenosine biosynthesis protein TsaE
MSKDSQGFALDFALPELSATEALGARIAAVLRVGDLVALEGDLGAGKTTLARAILAKLGVTENVPSPTFTLVQEYETPELTIRHFDLYRLEKPSEIVELGLDDALLEGAALIEWPERAGGLLPDDRLHVALSHDAGERRAQLSGPKRWQDILMETPHVG